MGKPVLSALNTLEGDLQGRRTVEAVSVDYPADAVVSKDFLLHLDEYFRGLNSGVSFVDTLLKDRASACPDQRIVLAGYSQGAMGMHRLIQRFSATDAGSLILQRMDAAILIGDGDRVARDGTEDYGGFHAKLHGIGLEYRSASGSGTAKFSRQVAARVIEVCNASDPICDSTGVLGDFYFVERHFSYPGGTALRLGSESAARSVLTIPLPAPRLVDLSTQVGIKMSHQLQADIISGFTLQWDVVSPGTMPLGLSLSSSGLISGTPSAIPSGMTAIRVRGILLGVKTEWQPATLRWNWAPPAPALSIESTSLPVATVGQVYGAAVTAIGGSSPYVWSLATGALPTGLTLSASTGRIEGTPLTAGVASFTLKVADSQSQVATQVESLTVEAAHSSPGRVLLFGNGTGFDASGPADLTAALVAAGYTVDSAIGTRTVPADLSMYQQLWHFGYDDFEGVPRQQLVDYVRSGRGLFLEGTNDSGGTLPLNDDNAWILNSLQTGPGVIVGHQGLVDSNVAEPVNMSVVGSAATQPNLLTTWTPGFPGGLANVPAANVFTSTATGIATAAVWGPSQVQGGGKVAILMSFSWMTANSRDPITSPQIAQNLAAFLS